MVTYQASNIAIQLHIVKVVTGSINLPWVQLRGVLHVEDGLQNNMYEISSFQLSNFTFCLKEALSSKPSLASAVYT